MSSIDVTIWVVLTPAGDIIRAYLSEKDAIKHIQDEFLNLGEDFTLDPTPLTINKKDFDRITKKLKKIEEEQDEQ